MARTVTLAQLDKDIRTQADGLGLSARHTPDWIKRQINQSIQHFREVISADGITHYLVHYTSTTGAGATSPFHFRTLDLSALPAPELPVVRVYGIDVQIDNGWRSLLNVDFADRNDYGTQGGEVVAFSNYQTAKVALLPAPATSRTYVAWYLPVFADLSADESTFDGVAGWEQWIVWDVVAKIVNRDEFPSAYNMATADREAFRRDIKHAASIVSKGAIGMRRDTWAERRGLRGLKTPPHIP